MPAVGQTITVVNKSGKIVSTSKHLVNVFKEARSAYGERKAEIKAQRKLEDDEKESQRMLHRQVEALTVADRDETASRASSRRSSRRGSEDGRRVKRKPVPTRTRRPTIERGVTDSFYVNDENQSSVSRRTRRSSWDGNEPRVGEITRRHTDGHLHQPIPSSRAPTRRSASVDDIDMDLAYGELPPPLPERRQGTETELRSKMINLQQLLDECNCVQHSVTAIIEHLQQKPEAMAAVALTLAEISSLITKMAPGALASLKTAFPAVIALLASPQFAIAAGVGVGVTIIAFGGYKIIKKIKANKDEKLLLESGGAEGRPALTQGGEMDELREIDRIEQWRRGIAEVEASSLGTSVEGEFLTPQATRTLIEQGRLTEGDLKKLDASDTASGSKTKTSSSSKKKKSRSERSAKTAGSSSSRRAEKPKKKEPSGLRMLFKKKEPALA